jgi:hypothetical protein
MSAALIWVMSVVIVVGLATWLVVVMVAARRPGGAEKHAEARRGNVQGGTHVGGGRSVAPNREEEVSPDDSPNDPTVPVRARGTSPMDL